IVHGPGLVDLDTSLFKKLTVGEKLTFRAKVFNVFNLVPEPDRFFAHCDQFIGRRDHSDGQDLPANPVRVEAPGLRPNTGSFLPRISAQNTPCTGYTRILCRYKPHAIEKRTIPVLVLLWASRKPTSEWVPSVNQRKAGIMAGRKGRVRCALLTVVGIIGLA